jgi:hypothetical protein
MESFKLQSQKVSISLVTENTTQETKKMSMTDPPKKPGVKPDAREG